MAKVAAWIERAIVVAIKISQHRVSSRSEGTDRELTHRIRRGEIDDAVGTRDRLDERTVSRTLGRPIEDAAENAKARQAVARRKNGRRALRHHVAPHVGEAR